MQFAKLSVNRPARQRLVVVTAAVKKGDKIPAFSLKDQNGRSVNIKPGGKPKVIFFYPKVRISSHSVMPRLSLASLPCPLPFHI